MNCNRDAAGPWEKFIVADAGRGKIALQYQGKCVSSENGTQPINCNRAAIGPWEQFEWIRNPDGTVSFKGSNGKFIFSEGGTTAMTCNRTTAESSEKFDVDQ